MKCDYCLTAMHRRTGGCPFDSEFRCGFCGATKNENNEEVSGPTKLTLKRTKEIFDEIREGHAKLKEELAILANSSTGEIYMKGFNDAKEIITKSVKRIQEKCLSDVNIQSDFVKKYKKGFVEANG